MAHIHPRPFHLALAVCLLVMTSPPPAAANGAFPDEFSVFFPPTAPHRILVGANFGLVISEDDGATWRYACEPWITQGSDVALSPYSVDFYQVTADSSVLAKSVHLTRTGDDACTWPQSTGSTDGHVVTDMFADPNDSTFVVAIEVDGAGHSSIVASHDGGKTFDTPAIFPSTADILLALEIAKSNSQVLYTTSLSTNGANPPQMWVSQNRGASWSPTTITGEAPSTQPLIIAIDPLDAAKVYLRVTGAQSDSIVIASGYGTSYQTALTVPGQFVAFVRGSDGTLYAATAAAQLYVHAPADPITQWSQFPGPHFRCLGQRPGTTRLYSCADFTMDGFSLGYSDDGGKTWAKMMTFTDILGPLTCGSVATACQAHWERIQAVLGIGDGGTGTPFDGGTGGTPDAGAQQDAGGGTTTPPPAKKSGCSTTGAGLVGLFVIAALLALRRRT